VTTKKRFVFDASIGLYYEEIPFLIFNHLFNCWQLFAQIPHRLSRFIWDIIPQNNR